jgi:cytochrome c
MLAACNAQAADTGTQAKTLIAQNCAACHTVPGVASARGRVGPSLAGFAHQQILAGKFANNPANLRRWIQHPQAMQPGGVMPEMGLTDAQAKIIADYLDTLDRK